ncbi:MAG TPA: response regulator transcription factor [Caulobacteraceae bacterium]
MDNRPTILLVDDEEQILRVLRPTLEAEGYQVACVSTGKDALDQLRSAAIAAVVLDLGLPDLDGKEVIRRARIGSNAPILVLSARDDEDEKIAALDGGAQDYLSKPFSVGELLARLRVLLRPTRSTRQVFEVGEAKFDFRRRMAQLPEGEIRLSARESEFLRLLAERSGDVVSHREIIQAVWGDHQRADAQFVRVLAGQVRQKIEEDPALPRFVLTVPGIGYRIADA